MIADSTRPNVVLFFVDDMGWVDRTGVTGSDLFIWVPQLAFNGEKSQIFDRLGLKTGDAINVFLAQVALREDLPFPVTTHPERLQTAEEQARNGTRRLVSTKPNPAKPGLKAGAHG